MKENYEFISDIALKVIICLVFLFGVFMLLAYATNSQELYKVALLLGILESVPMIIAYVISWQSYEKLLKMKEDEEKEEA